MNPIRITKHEIQKLYKPVDPKTHKGTQGHALLIGGSYGKMGSICLSGKAAIKSGCGLVSAFIPECGYEIMQTAIPEVMVIADSNHKFITQIAFDRLPQAIGIGPGIGQQQQTQQAFYDFLKRNNSPLVIDADAINILAQNPTWLSMLPSKSILTPHQKELERLIGKWDSESEKFDKTTAFCIKHHCIIVMKGAPTFIIDAETVYENTTGNAALATAGSGDVLTGIITSLRAQSYGPLDAAMLGAYLHGLTADIALPETGYESFIASDVIRYLGLAFLTLKNNPKTIGFK